MKYSWTHLMCEHCWFKLYPIDEPVRCRLEPNYKLESCCFCGRNTKPEIYVRRDPAELNCKHNE